MVISGAGVLPSSIGDACMDSKNSGTHRFKCVSSSISLQAAGVEFISVDLLVDGCECCGQVDIGALTLSCNEIFVFNIVLPLTAFVVLRDLSHKKCMTKT